MRPRIRIAGRLTGVCVLMAVHLGLAGGCVGSGAQHELSTGSGTPDDAAAAAVLADREHSSGVGSAAPGRDADGAGGSDRADGNTDGGNAERTERTGNAADGGDGEDGGADSPERARNDSPALSPFDNFHAVARGRAYRSAQLTPEKLRNVIEAHGIRTVVNLRGPNPGSEWYDEEKAACAAAGVRMVDVPLSAGSLPPSEHLLALFDLFQETAAEPLLIHCRGGADRSGMISAMWRMEMLGEDRETALRELSWLYGHFPARYPNMTAFIRMFEPSREWIVNEYNPVGEGGMADD